MSDIVERLRTAEYKLSEHQQERIFQEAADEIERLQAERDMAVNQHRFMQDEWLKQKAVVDAARKLIEEEYNEDDHIQYEECCWLCDLRNALRALDGDINAMNQQLFDAAINNMVKADLPNAIFSPCPCTVDDLEEP